MAYIYPCRSTFRTYFVRINIIADSRYQLYISAEPCKVFRYVSCYASGDVYKRQVLLHFVQRSPPETRTPRHAPRAECSNYSIRAMTNIIGLPMAIDIRCVTQKDPYVMQHRRFLNKSQDVYKRQDISFLGTEIIPHRLRLILLVALLKQRIAKLLPDRVESKLSDCLLYTSSKAPILRAFTSLSFK